MLTKSVTIASICALALSQISFAPAQQPERGTNKAQQKTDAESVDQQPHWKKNDQKLATCMVAANQQEVVLGKIAESKAQSDEVKSFAKTLVKEHRGCLEKLQRLVPEASQESFLDNSDASASKKSATSITLPNLKSSPEDLQQARTKGPLSRGEPPSTSVIQQLVAVPIDADSQSVDLDTLHREIAEEVIQSLKNDLNRQSGTEFDKRFIGDQISRQAAMKAQLVVFHRHASDELKGVILENIDMLEKHGLKAEEIMRSLRK